MIDAIHAFGGWASYLSCKFAAKPKEIMFANWSPPCRAFWNTENAENVSGCGDGWYLWHGHGVHFKMFGPWWFCVTGCRCYRSSSLLNSFAILLGKLCCLFGQTHRTLPAKKIEFVEPFSMNTDTFAHVSNHPKQIQVIEYVHVFPCTSFMSHGILSFTRYIDV